MLIYIFKSETKNGLSAFAGDLDGSKLPESHGPWQPKGVITADKRPPHNLPRQVIEDAIRSDGFQLWRMKPKAT